MRLTVLPVGGEPRLALAVLEPADLRARIQILERDLVRLRQQLRDQDDGRLLRALAIGTRGCVFTVTDLYTRALLDLDLAAAVGGLRPKQLGKRLARLVDRNLEGMTVRHVLETKDGWMWEIDFHQGAGVSR